MRCGEENQRGGKSKATQLYTPKKPRVDKQNRRNNECCAICVVQFPSFSLSESVFFCVSPRELEGFIERRMKQTSDAGSRYRCGRVGRGIQPPSTPQVPHGPNDMHKMHLKRSFLHFSTRVHGPTDQRTDGWTDGRTDGRTKPLIELRVRN